MPPDTMSGGAVVPVLEDIRRMSEVGVFCLELAAFFLSGLFFYRVTRGR